MKLKTLKDLRFTEKGDFWNWKDEMSYSKNCKQLVEELKQEAIKWVKSKELIGWNDTLRFIKHFFNITEDDLK